jgi:4-carboxymuconolactone decarboxylase
MKVLRFSDVEVEPVSGGIFTGEVKIQRIVNKEIGSKDLNIAYVFFPPGVKNTWHTHDYDQCLWILGGKGVVASEKEEYEAEVGMAFLIPAGERHWHGSVDENHFSHISIIGGTS